MHRGLLTTVLAAPLVVTLTAEPPWHERPRLARTVACAAVRAGAAHLPVDVRLVRRGGDYGTVYSEEPVWRGTIRTCPRTGPSQDEPVR